jgi:putative heme iron utilization protein
MSQAKKTFEIQAATLYRSCNTAILSTLSKREDGHPFGSFITYVTGQNRDLMVYASDIAEHTKNILNDTRACVTISSVTNSKDIQDNARLSIMGDLHPVPDAEIDGCQQRFVKFLPESKKYAAIHGFNFYRLIPSKVRWIGGFGQIAWLETEKWKSRPQWQPRETGIIEHMNQDHSNLVCSALNAVHKIADPTAEMLSLCIDGYYIKAQQTIYYISFNQPCYTEKELRAALVQQANDFRDFELNDNLSN